MNRRTVIATAGLPLSLTLGGCLSSDDEPSTESDDDDADAPSEPQASCYEILRLRVIDLEDHVDWDDADVTVVPADDKRIADVSVLQALLAEVVARKDGVRYEYDGDEFDAVEDHVQDPDGIAEPIADLPAESLPDVPPGPYVRHEGEHFAVEADTWRECDE